MKLKPDHKVSFLLVGFLFAWFAIYIMATCFYEGVVEVTVNIVQGGTYRPYYLRGNLFWLWMICIVISSLCLAIGLRAEELK